MSEPYAPDGFARVTPYLTVKGAQKLLDFLVAVFDAQVVDRTERPDGTLAHATVRIGDSHIELSDATEQWGPMPGAIHIYVPDVDQTHQRALANGAKGLHEPMEMDYGERASAVRDPLGNSWYIATHRRKGSERFETAITPMLSVRGGPGAIDFYKRAFGAIELTRFPRPDGGVVAELAIDGVRFGLTDESREAQNLSPESLGGTSVRINLVVANPDAVAERAIAAGARSLFPVADQAYGWRQGRVVDPFGHHWLIGRPLK